MELILHKEEKIIVDEAIKLFKSLPVQEQLKFKFILEGYKLAKDNKVEFLEKRGQVV